MRPVFLACLFVFYATFTAAAQSPAADLLDRFLDLPAPPPVDEKGSPSLNAKTVERPPDFFDRDKVPPDDAPLEDLLSYWKTQSQNMPMLRFKLTPSEKTVERLLEFCEETPEFTVSIINILPPAAKVAGKVKRFRDKIAENESSDYLQLDNWLYYNSTYFVDQLLKKAENVRDKDGYVVNQRELLALARVDWDKALPILDKLAGDKTQPVSAALAKWAFYARALETAENADITKYRRQLQDVVEDRAMPPGARDLAFDALVSEKDWDGRDDWYLTLLADETLFDLRVNGRSYTGLTTLILYSPPEKYVEMMKKLVESKNQSVRRAAITNLVSALNGGSAEAARALLPWASNPDWAGDFINGRTTLIAALGKFDIPESVPALINIFINEEDHRQTAAEALTRYKDARAVPVLKTALAAEKNNYHRQIFIKALDASGGIGDDEKMAALEAYAATVSTPDGIRDFFEKYYSQYAQVDEKSPNQLPVMLNVGHYVSNETEPSDGLVIRAAARLKALRKAKSDVAAALAGIMQKWRGRMIYIEKLRQIRDGEADLEMLLSVLAQRREIFEKIPSEVYALRTANGAARGLAPCLADDEADRLSVLRQADADAKIALLGCARLLRARLPVAEIGTLLKNLNKLLALAAERYLESEDGVEARTLVLANRPGEALILGARHSFTPAGKPFVFKEPIHQIFQNVIGRGFYGANYAAFEKNEQMLRDEVKTDPELLAVYAVLPNKPAGHQVIRVYKDKIVFTIYEDAARYRERLLTAREYEDFYRLLLEEKIDAAVPHFGYCAECEGVEFVMFGKNGGRRVFSSLPSIATSPLKRLLERFAALDDGRLKLRYRLADKMKGLEVLLADEKFPARAVWKNGGELRVLVEDRDKESEIQKTLAALFEVENKIEYDAENYQQVRRLRESQDKRREEQKYAHFFWRAFANGELGAIAASPPEAPFLYDETQFPETADFDPLPRAWQSRAGVYEIRAARGEEENGLYKVSRGQPHILLKKGFYDYPVTTADGKWVIATKMDKDWSAPKSVVRINLETGREFPVGVPPADVFRAVAFIASHNKVLLARAGFNKNYPDRPNADEDVLAEQKSRPLPNKDDKNPSPAAPEFYLLDAGTGAVQPVKGDFRPFENLTYRFFQPARAAGEFWTAVYDAKLKETAIGRYDTKTFTFQPAAKLPEIKLSGMDVWVDEKEAKIYFVYEGHLLAAPLAPPQK